MLKTSKSALAAAACAAALSGCAVGGHSFLERSSPVKIATVPAGATATSEYGDSCETPCSLRLLIRRGGTIEIAKEGYETVVVNVGSRTSKAAAAVGITADAAYYLDDPGPADVALDALDALIDPGAKYKKLDTRNVSVRLTPTGGAALEEEDIASSANVDEDGVILLDPARKR